MRQQRLQSIEQAGKNQAALKAKLIEELQQIGGSLEADYDSEDDDEEVAKKR